MTMTGPHFTAGDVPGLRRDLADWYGGQQGVQFYYGQAVMCLHTSRGR